MLLDGGIQLESCALARLSTKTVLSQNLSSHIAGALETLVPQLVMTSNCLGPRTEWWLSVGMKWASGPCQGSEKSYESLKLSIASQGWLETRVVSLTLIACDNTCADGRHKGGVDPDQGPARNS